MAVIATSQCCMALVRSVSHRRSKGQACIALYLKASFLIAMDSVTKVLGRINQV